METKERLICTICKYVYGNSPRVRYYYSSRKRVKDEKKKKDYEEVRKTKKGGEIFH